jgi:hypothetical protein
MAVQQEDFYVWRPPAGGQIVYLSLDVVDRVLQDVLRGFGSLPKRGAEVGGLLLGRISGAEVWIDGQEAVACGYAHGPSYELKGKDEEKFAEAIERHSGRVVGFYRSDTRDTLTLASEDLGLLDRYLPSAGTVALLIRPYATKVSRAGFFLRENGAFPASTPLDFAFSRKLLLPSSAPAARPVVPPAADPLVEVEATSEPAEIPEAPAPPPARSRRDVWAAALTLAVALGWSAGYFVARNTAPPPDPAVYRLGLTVERASGQLKVTWDSRANPMRTAVRGELRVEDGGQVKAVPLQLDQLRMGEAMYESEPGRARFELRVQQTAGSVVSEVVEFTRSASAAP